MALFFVVVVKLSSASAVPSDVMAEFLEISQNPTHELEVLPVLIACKVCGKRCEGALIVHYMDNESVRMAHVRGSGETMKKAAYATFAETSSQTLSQTTYNQVQGRPFRRSPMSQKKQDHKSDTPSQILSHFYTATQAKPRKVPETKQRVCLVLVPTC